MSETGFNLLDSLCEMTEDTRGGAGREAQETFNKAVARCKNPDTLRDYGRKRGYSF